jgi:hypothetical protein
MKDAVSVPLLFWTRPGRYLLMHQFFACFNFTLSSEAMLTARPVCERSNIKPVRPKNRRLSIARL